MSVPTFVWVAMLAAIVACVAMAEVFTETGRRRGVIACGVALLVIAGIAFALYAMTTMADEPRVTDWNALHERVAELED